MLHQKSVFASEAVCQQKADVSVLCLALLPTAAIAVKPSVTAKRRVGHDRKHKHQNHDGNKHAHVSNKFKVCKILTVYKNNYNHNIQNCSRNPSSHNMHGLLLKRVWPSE